MAEISNLQQLRRQHVGFIAKTNPAEPLLDAYTVTTPAEQKLNLDRRGEWLQAMIELSQRDIEARRGFENDLATLRGLYKNIVTDEVIRERCERLAALRQSLNIRITDNRQAYSRQTTRAVNALCGGAV